MRFELFSSNDYRALIQHLRRDTKTSQKDLAQAARVHTSYFSRVMQGDADFSPSQMFAIARALGLEGKQLEYCMLVVELAQATDESHRQFLRQKIFECQKEMDQLKGKLKNINKNLDESEIKIYYEEAITAKIHMLFTIDQYCQNINLIKRELNIDEDKLLTELTKLEKLGLIERKGTKVETINRSIHLAEDHPLSKHNHMNWRLETVHKLTHQKKKANDYHFSACFTANDREKELIKARFKEFIVDVQKIVTDTDKVSKSYHLAFDLY